MEFYLIPREEKAETLVVQREPRKCIGVVSGHQATLNMDISSRTRHSAQSFLKDCGITVEPNP